jgi:hypothetical protein
MTQETAVDWLVEFIQDHCIRIPENIILKVKEIEREQMGQAYISGGFAGLHFPLTKDAFDKKYLEDKFTAYYKANYTKQLLNH